jgi:hypothetical protein
MTKRRKGLTNAHTCCNFTPFESPLCMINETLDFLVAQLNEYIRIKTGDSNKARLAKLTSGGNEIAGTNTLICQVVNLEEERIGKAQLPLAPPVGSGFPIRNPEIKLNICMLIAANPQDEDGDYRTSLQLLSLAITFFQFRHYFTAENSPSMPSDVDSLIVELYPISLENQSYLWGALGVKYRPSVVYKIRMIKILEDSVLGSATSPRDIQVQLASQS